VISLFLSFRKFCNKITQRIFLINFFLFPFFSLTLKKLELRQYQEKNTNRYKKKIIL